MKKRFSIIALFFLLLIPDLTWSEKKPAKAVPSVSLGISGSFGMYSAWNREEGSDSEMNFEQDLGYGGGLIFEKMFTTTLGLQSGIWYARYSHAFDFYDDQALQDVKTDLEIQQLAIPLYLLISTGGKTISFDVLFGLSFNKIITASFNEHKTSALADDNAMKYLHTSQIAASGGFMVKIRTGLFTDIFTGCLGDFYLSDLVDDSNDTYTHSYNYRIIAGIMFRTNLIP